MEKLKINITYEGQKPLMDKLINSWQIWYSLHWCL